MAASIASGRRNVDQTLVMKTYLQLFLVQAIGNYFY